MNHTTVPVVVEDVKSYPGFQFTRCLYFTMESEEPSPGWMLRIEAADFPFTMLGLSGIVQAPSFDEPQFTSPDQLEDLIVAVEARDALYVSIADIWLPNALFNSAGHGERNAVFRLAVGLFSLAFEYRHARLSTRRFVVSVADLPNSIRYSPEETRAIGAWATRQMDLARERFPKNRERALRRGETEGDSGQQPRGRR